MQSLLKRHKTPMLKTLSEATRSTVMSHCTVLLTIFNLNARIAAGFLVVSPPPLSFCSARLHVYSAVLQGMPLFCRTQVYMCSLLFCGVFCCFAGHMFTWYCGFAGPSLCIYSVVLQGTHLHVYSVVLQGTCLCMYSVVLQHMFTSCWAILVYSVVLRGILFCRV